MNGLFLTSRWHWWSQVNSILVECHLSETNGLYQARTWMAHMTDRDANRYHLCVT